MSYFAKIDNNNIVTEVIVVEQDFIDSGIIGDSSLWIQTSRNNDYRKQCAGKDYTYDKTNDVFISSKPFASWTLDDSFDWQPPTAKPDDSKFYKWNEETTSWDEVSE